MKKTTLALTFAGLLVCLTFRLHAQHVALQPEKMSVFYFNIDNPVVVVVENHPCSSVIAKAIHGTLTRVTDSCSYMYRNNSCEGVADTIYLGLSDGDTLRWIDTVLLRLKPTPTPVVSASGKSGGYVSKQELLNSPYIFAQYQNFDIDVNFPITSYSIKIFRKDSMIFAEKNFKDYRYSPEFIHQITVSEAADKITFFNVQVEGAIYGCWGENGITECTFIIKPSE